MKKLFYTTFTMLFPILAFAEEAPKIDTGNTAWMIVATTLVMLMTPAGLALFYGGMTRSKNILNTIGMSFLAYCITSVVWVLWGYTLAFGTDISGLIGSLEHIFLVGISLKDVWSTGNIPTLLFVMFQLTFAAITVALISGSVIERMKFSTWLIIVILWITLVYAPIAHWIWGGGFLSKLGVLDFAGGTVIETNSGIAGLVMALLLGKRLDYGKKAILPSSVVLTTVGAILLWFGWFGFNAGSELSADGIAVSAFLVTNTAAAFGAISWMLTEWIIFKKPTMLGAASGVVAGLVAITPAAGFIDLAGSIIIGIVAGLIGFVGIYWVKKRFGYDDSLDVFGVHGLNGIWGTIATGIFANPLINPAGTGLLYGNPKQILIQLLAVLVTIVYTAFMTFIVYFIASFLTKGARVDKESEIKGLDEAIHGERGFEL
ncbi:ammonium transporter [Venenivibrio stagnispumantis]|uniref:Ammonium transporter n=1 Tax=Venenivibrio stagnispumantis TaxID=407998 RepID=A0AA45WI39_9AQUI|nr:ammonium transporter [Venenivibrio stagnispumantis]MCW4572717.1 ammonium transporter [Venenivibrio stagnispumantis]SMP00195.1 ammonium transporter [Venenivibrio stagnispumantis]